jgi:uncharacterized caspase-like protein
MEESMDLYAPGYSASRALIVGINQYKKISPLSYAVHDAEGVKETLIADFGFPSENIEILIDDNATKENIMKAFLRFADDGCEPDDRIVFFFAGHGHTRSGRRREVGYLVPIDGDIDDISTLIKWDYLTDDSDLIPAKHILFIMDACYGGLALTRSFFPGSKRFLHNMLQRFSRQVITAGKADEVVSDSGGPIPNHSVFTGHLLEGLKGKAMRDDGILTASSLMSYVYERVSKDRHSKQTPHYGFLEGDGDFIFKGFPTSPDAMQQQTNEDILLTMPASEQGPDTIEDDVSSLVTTVKEMLSDKRHIIQLHDLMISELQRFLALTADDLFLPSVPWSVEEFHEQINRYEASTDRLQAATCCISYWGEAEHQMILEKIVSRMTDHIEQKSGLSVRLALRWYPLLLIIYFGGISAVAAGKYKNLRTLLEAKVRSHRSSSEIKSLISILAEALSKTHEAFKMLPGHERHYTPQSEYLFKFLQPLLDDLLFLGKDYEIHFDRFEVLFALVCKDNLRDETGVNWLLDGRFAYKYHWTVNPFGQVLEEVEDLKGDWLPIQAGMFKGSYDRFRLVASEFEEQYLKKLNWR